MAQVCPKCRAPQAEEEKVCGDCEATLNAAAVPSPKLFREQAPASLPALSAASTGYFTRKIVLIVLGVVLLFGLLSAGAGAYFYYHHLRPQIIDLENTVRTLRASQGAPPAPTRPQSDQATSPGRTGAPPHPLPSNPAPSLNPVDVSKVLQHFGVKVNSNSALAKISAVINRPEVNFPALSPRDPALYKSQLVFRPGMTIVLSISEPLVGDYDVLISITFVSAHGVSSNYSTQLPVNRPGTTSPADAAVLKSHMLHTDSEQDMLHATNIMPFFSDKFPQAIPGATSFHLSQDAFNALKSGRGVDLTFADTTTAATFRAGPNDFWASLSKHTCHATRSGSVDAAFPALLNGKRVILPALYISCPHDGDSGAEYILDDPKMALFLAARNGQLTQLNYPRARTEQGGGQSIEQSLAKEGRVDVYGIYFDFGTDKLRPESSATLEEIASALRDHPSWKLSVNSHTDNVGGDAYNLDLSNRRAAAVRQALVTEHHIDAGRLHAKGFGDIRPKESNDSLQGRARNRRIELVRE